MSKPKVEITGGPGTGGRVLVDGVDISRAVAEVRITINASSAPMASMDVYVDKVNVETDLAEAVHKILRPAKEVGTGDPA